MKYNVSQELDELSDHSETSVKTSSDMYGLRIYLDQLLEASSDVNEGPLRF
jgi:hypothetical protein